MTNPITKDNNYLLINNVFETISGEVGNPIVQGSSAIFIRLGVCDLRCSWCDAPHSLTKEGSTKVHIEELVKKIHREFTFSQNFVITGGEPLLQQESLREFIKALKGYYESHGQNIKIQIETAGHIYPNELKQLPYITYIVDYKLPGAGNTEHEKMLSAGLYCKFPGKTFMKFVVGSIDEVALGAKIQEKIEFYYNQNHQRTDASHSMTKLQKPIFCYSPVHDMIHPYWIYKHLREWKVSNFVINLQIHKYVGIQNEEEEKQFF